MTGESGVLFRGGMVGGGSGVDNIVSEQKEKSSDCHNILHNMLLL